MTFMSDVEVEELTASQEVELAEELAKVTEKHAVGNSAVSLRPGSFTIVRAPHLSLLTQARAGG